MVPLQTPARVSWLNDQTFALLGHIDLRVQVRGTTASRTLRFMVCPRTIDLDMVIGWQDARNPHWNIAGGHSLIDRLAMLLSMQRDFGYGLRGGAKGDDGNRSFPDVDGNIVETDELLWQDDRPDPDGEGIVLPTVSVHLPPDERRAISDILEEFRDVFNPELLVGGARIEPMEVNMVPGWEPPKRQLRRKYSPAITAAIQQELDELLRDSILVPSDAPSGAPVHMVPKPSSPSGYRF